MIILLIFTLLLKRDGRARREKKREKKKKKEPAKEGEKDEKCIRSFGRIPGDFDAATVNLDFKSHLARLWVHLPKFL